LLATTRELKGAALAHDDDHALLARCRDGDDDAFAVLVDRHQARIARLALQMLGDPEEAQDVAQDAFVRLYTSLRSFRGEASLSTWLYRVVVNLCHRRLGKLRRRGTTYLADTALGADDWPSDDARPHDRLARQEQLREVRRAVASLSPKYRAVIALRYFHDLSYRDIAAVLRLPLGTVESRLHDARRALRRRMDGDS
jgi:RNA polymerase sigma-70 factor (ECF subfamily)